MFPRGLIIAVVVGISAGALVGVFLVTQKNPEQLIFVEGASLSLVTDKIDFNRAEEIKIKIINSGTSPLTFNDSSYGLKITGLDGRVLYTPISFPEMSHLAPNQEKIFLWNQTKNDGDLASAGTYKITSSGKYDDLTVKKSITINIHK